jgi:hypothetical protein
MTRHVYWIGVAVAAPGLLLFLWKAVALGLPIAPSEPEGLWRVELEIQARSSAGGGSIRAAIPSSRAGQVIDDERVMSDRLRFSVARDGTDQIGIWKGSFSGVHHVSHAFRAELSGEEVAVDEADEGRPSDAIVRRYTAATATLPANDPEVWAFLLGLELRGPEDQLGRARGLLTFVADEVELVPDGSADALLCLATRECGVLGKERLLATLLRASGVPARVIQGLRLRKGREPEPAAWVEAWQGGWVPISASGGFFGKRPENLLAIRVGDEPLVSSVGMAAISYRYRAIPEQLRPDELAAVMVPASAILAPMSLYRLPVATQRVLRVLLAVPIGALMLALLRNVVGISTFGTFLPVLVALALRESNLLTGLLMFAGVVVLGLFGRMLMDRLHLLLVPRLCIVLCLVVIAVVTLAVVGRTLEERDLLSGVLFPIVIITMLIERFSISIDEEGMRSSVTRLAWTAVVTMLVYPLFQSTAVAHLMFGFPELVLVVMGALIWIGGYTGYRVSELIRFRSLAQPGTPA